MARPLESAPPQTHSDIEKSCRAELKRYPDPTVVHKVNLQVAIAEERYADAARCVNLSHLLAVVVWFASAVRCRIQLVKQQPSADNTRRHWVHRARFAGGSLIFVIVGVVLMSLANIMFKAFLLWLLQHKRYY